MEAAELRASAWAEHDPRKRVWLLAVANVRDGVSVETATRSTGRGRATLYRWLVRDRGGGPDAYRPKGHADPGGGRHQLAPEHAAVGGLSIGLRVFSAVCPGRHVGCALILPRCDTAAMSLFLAELSSHITPRARASLVLDGACWHRGQGAVLA